MLSAATQNPAAERFQARFRRVLEFIDAHLDERLTLERLSEVAAFSPFHFHREFSELFGIGTYQYLQLVRLHRAAYRLAYRPEQSVTSIAHDSGYDGSDAFARAFRKRLGQSPSEFRQEPDWTAWHAMQHQLSELRNRHMSPSHLGKPSRSCISNPYALQFSSIAVHPTDSVNRFADSSPGASSIACRRM